MNENNHQKQKPETVGCISLSRRDTRNDTRQREEGMKRRSNEKQKTEIRSSISPVIFRRYGGPSPTKTNIPHRTTTVCRSKKPNQAYCCCPVGMRSTTTRREGFVHRQDGGRRFIPLGFVRVDDVSQCRETQQRFRNERSAFPVELVKSSLWDFIARLEAQATLATRQKRKADHNTHTHTHNAQHTDGHGRRREHQRRGGGRVMQ